MDVHRRAIERAIERRTRSRGPSRPSSLRIRYSDAARCYLLAEQPIRLGPRQQTVLRARADAARWFASRPSTPACAAPAVKSASPNTIAPNRIAFPIFLAVFVSPVRGVERWNPAAAIRVARNGAELRFRRRVGGYTPDLHGPDAPLHEGVWMGRARCAITATIAVATTSAAMVALGLAVAAPSHAQPATPAQAPTQEAPAAERVAAGPCAGSRRSRARCGGEAGISQKKSARRSPQPRRAARAAERKAWVRGEVRTNFRANP